MKTFPDKDDFLLDSGTARELYHKYAEKQPIFDYHNHLSPKDIAEHRHFHDLYELWLETDHYKWRAMRANGVDERYITGNASAYEKFEKWAEVLPRLVGSPLYHWTHLELWRYFGIYEPLTSVNAMRIWKKTKEMMQGEGYDAVSLLKKMDVRVLCTTDDPADDLRYHRQIREDDTIPFKVLPSFRPDRILSKDEDAIRELMEKYETEDLKEALSRALDHFRENGCLVSDHGFSTFEYGKDEEFSRLMIFLGKEYARRGIVMQMHLGPIRNNSPKLLASYGKDAGADSVGMVCDPIALSSFLGALEYQDALPKTILYNLNPCDNSVLSTMAGNFAPRVQYGAAWWFNDHYRGIRAQLDELMETGALASSVGMLTDSRSFTSFVRHDYFRRILCQKLGELVESGMYPDDMDTLGKIVEDVCYGNAESFFQGNA
ncbi:MAG: glucuronate isomerase [Erysipelotrichaceae bacterium]|nr:glucuronate isomerase [Erysipelotrichaceae bacterium]